MPDTPNPRPASQPPTANAVQAARNLIAHERPTAGPLPRIRIPGGDLSVTTSTERLFTAIAESKQLFYRGGVVVELVDDEHGPAINIVDAASAVSRFERYVQFVKAGKSTEPFKPTTITESIAKIYLKSDAARNLLPKLKGIVNCPILYEVNGELHQTHQGYNEPVGLYVTAREDESEGYQLDDAVGLLSGILNNFDFLTPGDRSRAIASLLTPALKFGGLIREQVPVDVAEADGSRSGKTYRQKLVGAIYNQTLAVVTKKGGGVGSMEETFSDHLVKGHCFIQFDNVRGKLDSQYLESFMTADALFPARIPYHGTVNVDPSKFMLFITSNGFEATKDLINRASFVRIRKREGFSFPSYDGLDLLGCLRTIQPLLISAVFLVIREWHRQGKKRTSETRHDFREWCQVLDWIVQNIFHEAPLMDGHDGAKERAANPSLSFLRSLTIALNNRNAIGQALTAAEISTLCLDESVEIPGVNQEDQTIEQAPMQIGRIMRPLFKDADEVIFDEYRIERRAEQKMSDQGNPFESYRYVFHLNTPPGHTPAPASDLPKPPVITTSP